MPYRQRRLNLWFLNQNRAIKKRRLKNGTDLHQSRFYFQFVRIIVSVVLLNLLAVIWILYKLRSFLAFICTDGHPVNRINPLIIGHSLVQFPCGCDSCRGSPGVRFLCNDNTIHRLCIFFLKDHPPSQIKPSQFLTIKLNFPFMP